MRFLADENVEKSVVRTFREADHDVVYITELSPGCTDEKIFELARSEGRILITNDTVRF